MATRDAVTCTTNWTLVFDSETDGNFNGGISLVGGSHAIGRVAASVPPTGTSGFVVDETELPIQILQSTNEKLYVRAYSGTAIVILA